jgi:hypothetical protein
LSACCQVRVGACGHVLSCLALNGLTIQGPQLLGHFLGTRKSSGAWLPVARVRAELGCEDELDQADRW